MIKLPSIIYPNLPTNICSDLDASITALIKYQSGASWNFQDALLATPCAVGDPIYTWKTSGTVNNINLVQSTLSRRPILRQSGALLYVEFDGIDDYMEASYTNPGTSPLTVYGYVQNIPLGGYPMLLVLNSVVTELRGAGGTNRPEFLINSSSSAVSSVDWISSFHTVIGTRDTLTKIYIDGVERGSTNGVPISQILGISVANRSSVDPYYFKGYVSELGILDYLPNVTQLHNYLL